MRTHPLVPILAGVLLVGACGGGDSPTPVAQDAPADEPVATLYWLDIGTNTVGRTTGPDFTDDASVVFPTGVSPDGVAVDAEGGKLYWTNMGHPDGLGGGTLQRANLDGTGVETIVEPGVTQTPKQMQVDTVNDHVYWADREGAKVWRAGLDGSNPEPLVSGHGNQQLVGVALDVPSGKVYFSDKNARKIFRTNLEMPAGQTHADRTDVELLVSFGEGAMPVDLDIDEEHRLLYWTDRVKGTVNRAPLEIAPGETAETRSDLETVVSGLTEPIGLSLDVPNDKLYYGQLVGPVIESALDGTNPREVARSLSVSGVAIAHVPAS